MKRFNYFFVAFIIVVMAATSCQDKITKTWYTFATAHEYSGGSSTWSFTADNGQVLIVNNGSSFSDYKVREGVKSWISFYVDDESKIAESTVNINLIGIDTTFVHPTIYRVASEDEIDSYGLDTLEPNLTSSGCPSMTYENAYVNCGFLANYLSEHRLSMVHVDTLYPDDVFRVYLCRENKEAYSANANWVWLYMPMTDFDLTGYSTVRFILRGNEGWFRLDYTIPSSKDDMTYAKYSIYDTRAAAAD